MGNPLHIGVTLPNLGPNAQPDTIRRLARIAERRGFGSVWVSDHIVMPAAPLTEYPYSGNGRPPFDPSTPYLDPFATLNFVAACTERVQLGIGVLVLPLRHPIGVAKQVASLDVLSGGRTLLGVGSGWMVEEFSLLEQGWADRGRRTDRGIDTLRGCWQADAAVPDGGRVGIAPPPRQGVRLPVLIGGHSSAALRRAVQRGDGWYATKLTPSQFAERRGRLRRMEAQSGACEQLVVGVRPDVVAPEGAATVTRDLADAGAEFVVLGGPFGELTPDQAASWMEAAANALGLVGELVPPIASRRSWPAVTAAVGPRAVGRSAY